MLKKLLFIVLASILFGCNNKPKVSYEFLNDKNLSNDKKIALIFKNDYLNQYGFQKDEVDWLKDLYKINNDKPFFCNDSSLSVNGKSNIEILKNNLAFGIPQNRLKINYNKNPHPLLAEIYLCLNTSRILHDLNNGIINFKEKKYMPNKLITPAEFIQNLKQLDTISLSQLFLKQGPADTNYRFLASHLYDFFYKYPADTNSFNLKEIEKETITANSRICTVLIKKGYLQKNTSSIENVIKALHQFQKDNGLAEEEKINTNTILALNESSSNKLLRAAISLDKIRQSKIHQAKYVRINIPEYKLYFYANDSLKSVHRIVVGKTTNQTPELTSKINRIVAFPYWKVPYSICKDEALPAIKKNITYLAKNHFKIYKNAVEINPATVNWKKMTSFPYSLIQQPGVYNSLGIMKFEFANIFSVYVHDTPSKSLFNRSVRNFSHGCMRCENPIELARIMLENDIIDNKPSKFTSDSLDTVMFKQLNRSIFLKVSIPIFVYYQSVVADRNKLVFHLDIYKRDDEYLNLLKTASKYPVNS